MSKRGLAAWVVVLLSSLLVTRAVVANAGPAIDWQVIGSD